MKAPVYVDSPLAISATEVFKENMNLFEPEVKAEIMKGDNPLEFPGLKFTRTADESKALNEDLHPSIIISASGMCEVGRIKHHLNHLTIILNLSIGLFYSPYLLHPKYRHN